MRRATRTLIALIVIGAVGAAAVCYWRISQPYKGYGAPEQFVDIPPGTGAHTIADRLVAAGVVEDRATFRLALWLSGSAKRLQAGEYRFDEPLTPLQVVDKLARGDVYVQQITFPEGHTIREMAQIYEEHGFGDAAAFQAAASNRALVQEIDPGARNLEGYLFPATYALPRKAGAPRLVRLMLDRFEQVVGPEMRKQIEARGETLRQVVTLASLVEKETARPEERPIVAAVYWKRLRLGMALQCDPTVIYALMQVGRYDGNLTRAGLMFDSPYNTYRYPGLPPGPIASPGKASLEGAANPAPVDYLYFVSRNDGSHEFARTLAEHNRNVHQFQIEYFREKRMQEPGDR
jgi:UPF0755 protein